MLTHWIIWILLTSLVSFIVILLHKNSIKKWLAIVYIFIWAFTSSITLSKWKVNHWNNSMRKVLPTYMKVNPPKNKYDPTALFYPVLMYFLLTGKTFKSFRGSIRKLRG